MPLTAPTACACGIPLEPWEVDGICEGCIAQEGYVKAKELQARRRALGLSQNDLARRLSVTQQYISAAETIEGYANVRYDLALRCIEYEERVVKLPRKWTKP